MDLVPPWSVPPGLIVPPPRPPQLETTADDDPGRLPAVEAGEAGEAGELADTEKPADTEDAWPGVACPANWFLRTPQSPPTPQAVPAPQAVPVPETALGPAAPAGTSTARTLGAVGPTKALGGRAGGPGLPPGRPAEGRRPAPGLSLWQKSQHQWSQAGIHWEQQPAMVPPHLHPASLSPVWHQEPVPRVPRPRSPQPSPSGRQQARGRHSKPDSLPPDRPPVAWPSHMQLPLGAPVFAAPAATDDGPAQPSQDAWTDQDAQPSQDAWTDQDAQPSQDSWTSQDTRTDQDTWTEPGTWSDQDTWDEPRDQWDDGQLPIRRRPSLPPAPDRGWPASDTLLLESPRSSARPPTRRGLISRRTATIGVPAIVLVAVAVLAIAMLTGHSQRFGPLAASQGQAQGQGQNQNSSAPQLPLTAMALATYPGQQQRGVFQTISRVVASGNTIVTIGSQTTGAVVRQQFFVSSDGGASWHLAPARGQGAQPALGHPAALLAGGQGGWVAVGSQAIWTSQNGLSWILAATHGITPQLPGDSVLVITKTDRGFLAAGSSQAAGGTAQAVIWTSADGVSWHRMTAAQLGLPAAGETVRSISYATWRGDDTVLSGRVTKGGESYDAAWLSTDGGSAWTRVRVPVDHGASPAISGLAFDGAGLMAVRPGRSASGADDSVSYFSPNGLNWQYASTIDPAGGLSPRVVKGSSNGFVVTGQTTAGQVVAYTSTGTGTGWLPTGPLGNAGTESVIGATVAADSTVIAVGYMSASRTGQQPVFLEANTTGSVRPVSLAAIPGGIIPEVTVTSTAVADGEQVAVGSADGYPAVWRKASGGSWALVSSLSGVQSLAGADPGLSALTSVTHGSAGWLAVGAPGPVIVTSADGSTWQPASGGISTGLAGVAAVAAASGPAGYIIVGKLVAPGGGCIADVWWSPNLTSWTRAHDVNDATGSSAVVAVAAGAHGFVSAGSHESKPTVWTTTDGRSWETIVLPLPAGAVAAVLLQIAINGNRVVALGQATNAAGTTPFAELSVDGGTAWQQVPFTSPGTDTVFTALTADAAGFTAAGLFGPSGQQNVAVWTSANGASWKPAQASGLRGAGSGQITALAPSGSVVTGIGSIATQQTQQTVTLTLPAR